MGDFDGVGQAPGLEVWRIEDKAPKPVGKKFQGQFYENDAYIVLKTTKKPQSSTLIHDVFFWLGKDVSQGEAGVAAYKAVELDESLGGGPTQHRETQGHESELFMQCFKSVTYKPGGVDSGFKHVQRDVYEHRLLHLKGSKMVRVTTMAMSSDSLNAGDVFVLDLGLKIIQWNGSEANRKEKAKALDICADIKNDERGGKATIIACEQGEEPDEFWSALGGRGAVKAATPDDAAKPVKGAHTLWKVSDASGAVTKTKVAEDVLEKSMLTSDDVYIMDNVAEIFVWVGKGASTEERTKGMEIGAAYATENGRPAGTKVIKVKEGTEPSHFKHNFKLWGEESAALPGDFSMTPRGRVASAAKEATAAELAAGMSQPLTARAASMEFVEGGDTEIWRIEGFEKVAVDDSLEGQFYAGDSYLIKYTYEVASKKKFIIYFWQGSQSSADEKGAAAILATKMDDELGGAATQVRVVMGKEPSHFVKLFGGKMVVHSGGKASGFKNKADADSYDADGTSLFHVRGTSDADARAVQVPEKAENLNSGDCFVLLTPAKMYVWFGGSSNETERETARKTASVLKKAENPREYIEFEEGSETDCFWEALGGKTEYPSAKWLPPGQREPALFHVSNATGVVKIEPVFDYSQADLEEEDVFILDVYTTIFVWLGSQANDKEKSAAMESAAEYIKVQNMDADTPVISVKSGSEPEMFQANFLGWDESKAHKAFVDPYEARLAAIKAANPPEPEPEPAPEPAPTPPPAVPSIPIDGGYTLNYEELKKPTDQLPKGIDPLKKEQYLSDEEFLKVLGSPRGEFNQMKAWKQAQIKKAAGLF